MEREHLVTFKQILENPYSWLNKLKERGERLIGILPMYVPEEIIDATGMLPVILPKTHEYILHSRRYIPTYFCDYCRSIVDLGLRGVFDCFEGLVLPDTCISDRTINVSFYHHLRYPSYRETFRPPKSLHHSFTRTFLYQELKRFKDSIQRFSSHQVTDDDLMESIKVYDEHRALMRRLYTIRRTKPGILSEFEMVTIVNSSMLMRKKEHNRLLAELLSDLEQEEPPAQEGVKLILAGTLCEALHPDLLAAVEESGGVVVDDDLYVGSRYFAASDGASITSFTDPLDYLTECFIKMIPCPTISNPEKDWGSYLCDMAKNADAKAVVIFCVLYCEPGHFAQYPAKTKLEAEGISVLYIETNQEALNAWRIATQLGALIESIERRK